MRCTQRSERSERSRNKRPAQGQWSCVECGSSHDRDINAARNIAALGIQSLAEGAYE
ncbi:zinc ribbon domain-containing protein [Granulosicoccus antarcticus]|uniref:zinc ribbon domain-containing protein n=1 Tax=Granulosicoccus antarcticus TaxID=437505 RepID=UPI003AB0E636